jgi:hypothetical protein
MRQFSRQLLLLFVILPVAQTFEATAQDFYPLEARNTWCYRVFYYNYPLPMDSATTQLGVLRDTLMPNGRTYSRLNHPDVLGATFVRVDSNYVYYFSPYAGNDVPMYNLRAAQGTVDTIHGWGPLGRSSVVSVTTQQIFGVQRTVRRYFFDGLVQYEVSLADGFGIVNALDYADGIWPFYAWWSIRGCIIRDTLYGTTVSVPENQGLPSDIQLYQNYPNPFNPSATIEFDISASGPVRLFVTNLLGQEVAQLVNEFVSVGKHEATFNGSNLASGVYIYTLSTPNVVLHRKLLLLK